jgi:hypothetical protein
MTNRIQLRRDTATNWTSANPVLLAGEVGVDLTNKKIKLGDGTTRWNSLEYWDDQESGDFDGSYSSLTGKPSLFSGSYTDLTNTPSIPTNTNQLTNDAGFITLNDVDLSGLATENYVDTAIGNIPAVDLSGLATENYVDTAIGNIPAVDLSGLATENYVDTAVSSLVDSAPGTLDTLNELAAALGDDANFATTVTTALGDKAPINNPTFTGTVGGVTATHVGLGNVTNESKATMFTNPTFTGTVSGVTKAMVGLGNVTNESKATMFTNPTFTGTVSGLPPATLPTNPVITGLLTFEPAYDATVTVEYPLASFTYNSDISAYVLVWGSNSVTERSILPFLEVGQALTFSIYSSSTGTTSNIGPYLVYEIVSSVDSMNPFMTNYELRFGPAELPVDNTTSITSITVPYTSATIGGYEIKIAGTLVTRSSTEVFRTQTEYTENVYDFLQANTWLVTEPTYTGVAFKNVPGFPTSVGRVTVMTLIITQGAVPIIPGSEGFGSATVNDYPVTFKWLGGTVPTGTANGLDVVSYVITPNALFASVSTYS